MPHIIHKKIIFKEGKSLLFSDLYDDMYGALCVFATNFVKVDAEAEDLVQDVFFKLWNKSDKFNSYATLKAYLYTATRNTCLNSIRDKNKKRNYVEHNDEIKESHNFFVNTMIEEETKRLIYKAISELSPQCRKILLLSMQNLKNREIAEDLGISENTVKSQKKIAYKVLREKLHDIWQVVIVMMMI